MGELYMRTIRLPDFLRELPPPLGYQGIRIEESKLNKIIFCLNIRDHLGRVYYPEVMWTIFHSIAGMNDEKVLNCEQINNILKIVKNKYKGLGKKINLDTLCLGSLTLMTDHRIDWFHGRCSCFFCPGHLHRFLVCTLCLLGGLCLFLFLRTDLFQSFQHHLAPLIHCSQLFQWGRSHLLGSFFRLGHRRCFYCCLCCSLAEAPHLSSLLDNLDNN